MASHGMPPMWTLILNSPWISVAFRLHLIWINSKRSWIPPNPDCLPTRPFACLYLFAIRSFREKSCGDMHHVTNSGRNWKPGLISLFPVIVVSAIVTNQCKQSLWVDIHIEMFQIFTCYCFLLLLVLFVFAFFEINVERAIGTCTLVFWVGMGSTLAIYVNFPVFVTSFWVIYMCIVIHFFGIQCKSNEPQCMKKMKAVLAT